MADNGIDDLDDALPEADSVPVGLTQFEVTLRGKALGHAERLSTKLKKVKDGDIEGVVKSGLALLLRAEDKGVVIVDKDGSGYRYKLWINE